MKLSAIRLKSQKKPVEVVNKDLRFKYSEKVYSLTCIVGKNGAGKTRFLNSIFENTDDIDLIFEGTCSEEIQKKDFAVIKYSSAIEYSLPNMNSYCYDVSTTYLLQKLKLNELNRYDVLNQVAVVANYLDKISDIINFKNKNFSITFSDQGEAIYSLRKKYFNSYLSKYAEDLFTASCNKYELVMRIKFIAILFEELFVEDDIEGQHLNGSLVEDLVSKFNFTAFTVEDDFYTLLSKHTSLEFIEQVKKFFYIYSLITDTSNNFFQNKRKFKFHNKEDLSLLRSIIDYFFPEKNVKNDSIVCEVFGVLSFSWNGLSSGEMSILNLLARLYSGQKDYEKVPNKLLLIDEVDLGLHPEWQRLWVSDVLPLISEILCSDGQELQVIITTHSPIILSDILNQDIIYLGDSQLQEKTFGQNIYTLFNNSFFLEDVQGKFVSEKLINLSQLLNELSSKQQFELTAENCGRLKDILGLSNITLINDVSVFKETLNRLINSIGEEIIRNYFNYLFNEINFYSDDKQNKIEKLKSQLRELEGSEF